MSWQATSLAADDNVATLLAAAASGGRVVVMTPGGELEIIAREAIALCHKIALVDIAQGAAVVKYGDCIGEATAPIRCGAWVHTHNLRSRRARLAEGQAP